MLSPTHVSCFNIAVQQYIELFQVSRIHDNVYRGWWLKYKVK